MMRDAWEEQGFAPEQVEALMPYGRESSLQTGDLLFDEKSVVDSFYVVLEGEVEISRLDGAAEIPVGTHGPGEFTGGLVLLTGRTSIHRGRAGAPSRVLEIDSETFRRMPAEVPDLADIFISGLASACATRSGPTASGRSGPGQALGRPGPRAQQSRGRGAAGLRRVGRGNPRGPTHLLDARRALLRQRTRGAGSPATRNGSGQCRLLDPLSLGDAEDRLSDWLGDRGCQEPWDMAPALAEAGLDTDRLEAMAGHSMTARSPVVWSGSPGRWISSAWQVRSRLAQDASPNWSGR